MIKHFYLESLLIKIFYHRNSFHNTHAALTRICLPSVVFMSSINTCVSQHQAMYMYASFTRIAIPIHTYIQYIHIDGIYIIFNRSAHIEFDKINYQRYHHLIQTK